MMGHLDTSQLLAFFRYDHIRFAAEALKLRDKVRIPDVFGEPQDEWI